jgi:hypothetical protein
VTITVFSRAELSKSTAALMLRARCITSPCASMSCGTRGFRAPVGHKNYCSCLSVGLHRSSNPA